MLTLMNGWERLRVSVFVGAIRLLCLVVAVGMVLLSSAATPAQTQNLCTHVSADENLSAILSSLFVDRLNELDQAGVLQPPDFVSRVRNTKFFICNDRVFDFITTPFGVKFDQSLAESVVMQAYALIVGQVMHNEFDDIDIFSLYRRTLDEVFLQNTDLNHRDINLESMISDISGGRIDPNKFLEREDVSRRVEGLALHGLGFLVLHEQCHIALDHAKKQEGVGPEQLQALQQQQELDADACAIEAVSRHEEVVGGLPGANFLGAVTALSAQIAFEPVFKWVTHTLSTTDEEHPAGEVRLGRLVEIVLEELRRRKADDPRFEATFREILRQAAEARVRFEAAILTLPKPNF